MTLSDYQNLLAGISHGKRLPGSIYFLLETKSVLSAELQRFLDQIIAAFNLGPEYNLVKFRTDHLQVSFLSYPNFFEDPHPALHHAATIDLTKGKVRVTHYAKSANPPILHRKETFLPPDHPASAAFRALTQAEEAAGLYEETSTIGFKLNWDRLLLQKGLSFQGHRLVSAQVPAPAACEPAIQVDRHKTALSRYDLSKPVKTLIQYGLLDPAASFFDYGCGQGSDVRGLLSLGHLAAGWDPVHRPHEPKVEADIVNLGYVLNVIDDPGERVETLINAHRLARKLLVVSALINETVELDRSAPFRDGVLTKRKTFQKFFEQHELQQFIEDCFGRSAYARGLNR